MVPVLLTTFRRTLRRPSVVMVRGSRPVPPGEVRSGPDTPIRVVMSLEGKGNKEYPLVTLPGDMGSQVCVRH